MNSLEFFRTFRKKGLKQTQGICFTFNCNRIGLNYEHFESADETENDEMFSEFLSWLEFSQMVLAFDTKDNYLLWDIWTMSLAIFWWLWQEKPTKLNEVWLKEKSKTIIGFGMIWKFVSSDFKLMHKYFILPEYLSQTNLTCSILYCLNTNCFWRIMFELLSIVKFDSSSYHQTIYL